MQDSLQIDMVSKCHAVAFSPPSDDGQPSFVAVGQSDGNIALCDAVSGRVAQTLQKNSRGVYCLSFSPAERGRLLAAGSADGTVRVWDTQMMECVGEFHGHKGLMECVAFSPDGSLLASGADDATVRLWYVASRTAGPVLRAHEDKVYGAAFSPSGRLLASASWDGTVRLWSMPEGTPGPVLYHDKKEVRCIAYSPIAASNLLASGCKDRIIRLWDVSGNGKLVRELKGHDHAVRGVAFSPDGTQLVSGSYDNTVKVWNVWSGNLLKNFVGHTEIVMSVAFHPNGKQVASASYDMTVRIRVVCEWSDRLHHLFGAELKRVVFRLMCVKARQLQNSKAEQARKPQLSMQLWLHIFQCLACSVIKRHRYFSSSYY